MPTQKSHADRPTNPTETARRSRRWWRRRWQSAGAGLRQLLDRAVQRDVNLSRLGTILVDGGYVDEKLVRWVMDAWGWILEPVLRPKEKRVSRDYERKPSTAESWLYIASIRRLVRRLT